MAELKVGQTAPRFSLKDKDGKTHQLNAAKADYTVLYFYPKDDTPGCTLEAKEFSSAMKDFMARNVAVVGVSGGNEKTKASFCKKYKLSVPLVSDTDFKVAKSYGAFGKKSFMGRTFEGIFRKTFLLDKKGKIARIFGSVKPEGHAEEVLKAIDELKKSGAKKPATKVAAAPKKKAVAKKSAAQKLPSKKATSRKAAPVKRAAKKVAARPAKRAVTRKKK
jgi:peroxiredoxin Q/BCP